MAGIRRIDIAQRAVVSSEPAPRRRRRDQGVRQQAVFVVFEIAGVFGREATPKLATPFSCCRASFIPSDGGSRPSCWKRGRPAQRRAAASQDGHTFRGYRGAHILRLPRVAVQSYRRRFEEDAAILQRDPLRRGLRARRHPRRSRFHLEPIGRKRHHPRLRRAPNPTHRFRRSVAGARSGMGSDLR